MKIKWAIFPSLPKRKAAQGKLQWRPVFSVNPISQALCNHPVLDVEDLYNDVSLCCLQVACELDGSLTSASVHASLFLINR